MLWSDSLMEWHKTPGTSSSPLSPPPALLVDMWLTKALVQLCVTRVTCCNGVWLLFLIIRMSELLTAKIILITSYQVCFISGMSCIFRVCILLFIYLSLAVLRVVMIMRSWFYYHFMYESRFNCQRCILGRQVKAPPPDSDTNSDLSQWHHSCVDKQGPEDLILKKIWDEKLISFIFHHKSHDHKIETVWIAARVMQFKPPESARLPESVQVQYISECWLFPASLRTLDFTSE